MAARSIASLTVSFGLVSIPVKLYSATEASRAISFNMLHKTCGSRLKQQYICIKEEVPAEDYIVPLGKARIARQGRDLSIITYAAMVYTAMEAAETLSREGIDVEIIDLRTISPLDRLAIAETVRKTSKVIVLHEHSRTGGIAGEIAAIINEEAFDALDGPIVRIAAQDSAVPFSPPQEEYFLPKVSDVLREARRLKTY
jgi:2-oxoisovalerate dehydrogenase E1 component beta subunit